MTGQQPQIQCWPVGDSVWLRAQDVTAAMRARGDEFAVACNETEDETHATAYRAVAEELRRLADMVDANVSMALTS
jgi:predicted signal transduction protein with EAL and GGDEF domain